MEQNRKTVTHLDICAIVGEHQIPAFNRFDLNALIPQTKLAAEIANDPGYQERIAATTRAIRGTDLKKIAEAIIETTKYAQEKFGERQGFNAGIEQAASYALLNTR